MTFLLLATASMLGRLDVQDPQKAKFFLYFARFSPNDYLILSIYHSILLPILVWGRIFA